MMPVSVFLHYSFPLIFRSYKSKQKISLRSKLLSKIKSSRRFFIFVLFPPPEEYVLTRILLINPRGLYMRHSIRKKEWTLLRTVIFGVILSPLVIFALSFIAALILSATKDPLAYFGIAGLVTLLLSSVVSATIITRVKGEGGMPAALISAAIVSLVLIVVGLIASAGKLSGGVVINCLSYIGASCVASFLFRSRGKKRHRA